MYVKQDGKIYIQDGDKLVGVSIYPDKVLKIDKTETILSTMYQLLSPYEIKCKYHINDGECYIFPQEKQEVEKNVTTGKVKSTSRKSNRK